ncbi:MAG: ABC transporter permease [Lachnospiraceae bacterium]|jgi:ABC-type dipeptide/oligopeptide/nickel transport system permease component
MWRYIVKRLLWLIVIVVCVALLIFTVMWFVPGDPAKIMLGTEASAADVEALRDRMGLNDPFIVQMGRYMRDTFLRLDFGTSYVFKVPVIQEFAIRLPRTVLLGVCSLVLNVIFGIPLGILAATHRNSVIDRGLLVFAMIFSSMPQFFFALLLVIIFALYLGWLPPFGIGSWQYWILPVISTSLSGIAQMARHTRASVLETIRADFVTTARAKGLEERKVIYKHMLPNALIPVVSDLGMHLSMIVGGSVVIETIFAFPGVGLYMLNAINGRDYPVVRSCVLILAVFSALVMLFVDLVYAFLDPRIKAQYVNYAAKKGGKK